MATTLSTKIQLRTDTEENWLLKNPVLGLGEIAIVCFQNDYKDIKIGNGLSSFTQIPYLYQNEINTDKITGKDLRVKSIAQGYNVKATPTSLATGIFTEADGQFDVVHGIEAKAKEGDDYAFVFNGTNLPGIANRYQSHGEGSFNVNPLSGLNGFYIGEDNLSSIFHNYFLSNEISNYYNKQQVNGIYLDLDNKIIVVDNKLSDYYKTSETSSSIQLSSKFDSVNAAIAAEAAARYDADEEILERIENSTKAYIGWNGHPLCAVNELSLINITRDDYYTLADNNQLLSGAQYIISNDTYINWPSRISIDFLSSETQGQDDIVSCINNIISIFNHVNIDGNQLLRLVTIEKLSSETASQDDIVHTVNSILSAYKNKLEPFTVIEKAKLDNYYTKSETSSAVELSVAFANVSVDLSEYVKDTQLSLYTLSSDNTVNLKVKNTVISAKIPEASTTIFRTWNI